eukprot:5100471-Karenia_brevis.AAC.1
MTRNQARKCNKISTLSAQCANDTECYTRDVGLGPMTSRGHRSVGTQTLTWPIDFIIAGIIRAYGKQRAGHLVNDLNNTRL